MALPDFVRSKRGTCPSHAGEEKRKKYSRSPLSEEEAWTRGGTGKWKREGGETWNQWNPERAAARTGGLRTGSALFPRAVFYFAPPSVPKATGKQKLSVTLRLLRSVPVDLKRNCSACVSLVCEFWFLKPLARLRLLALYAKFLCIIIIKSHCKAIFSR